MFLTLTIEVLWGEGGGNSHIKGAGMLVGKFQMNL